MKKIILIDDNIKKVEEIFGKIYDLLWKGKGEEGIVSKVIFFGDQFKEEEDNKGLSDDDIDSFRGSIKRMLSTHCRNEELWNCNGDMYMEKKKLIEDIAKSIKLENNEDIKKLLDEWKLKEGNLETSSFEPLLNLIWDGSEKEKKESCFLIDVILFLNDIDTVEKNIPIISMGIYHALKKDGFECYLYSSYAFDYLLMDKYKEIYMKLYNEEIEVYPSKIFFSKIVDNEKCLFYHIK